mmetsp:Transcript_29109/g.62706  ORF Transcript_29109/g.62706 Transcript_29109/m.62706 type:complete len:561 (-) Transcript_29109:1174-2856(-)
MKGECVGLVVGQTNHVLVVHPALGPDAGQQSGQRQGEASSAQQDGGGLGGPKEPVVGAGREEREEVGDGHLQVHGGGDLPVGDLANAQLVEGAVLVPRVEQPVEQQQGGGEGNTGQHGGDQEQHRQVPHVGVLGGDHVVVTDRDEGSVVQQGDEHEHQHGQLEVVGPLLAAEARPGGPVAGLEVEGLHGQHGDEEEDQQLQSGRDAVRDEVLHALEDAAGDDDALHDGGEALIGEHDISSGASGVRGTSHSDTHVGALQGRRIVHTVSSHARLEAHLSQALHDQELVLGEHLREPVSRTDVVAVQLGQLRGSLLRHGVQHRQTLGAADQGYNASATLDAIAQVEHTCGLHGDKQVVSGDHLHLHAVGQRAEDGLLGVVAGGGQEGQQADHVPLVVVVGLGHGQGADASGAQGGHVGLASCGDLLVLAQLQQHVGRALGGLEGLAGLAVAQGALGALHDGVEGHKVELLNVVQRLDVGLAQGHGVQSVSRGFLPLRSHGGVAQSGVLVLALHVDGGVLLDNHLVHRESTSLVGAEHGHAGHVLDSSQTSDDSAVLGELLGA